MVGIYLSGTGNTKYCIEKMMNCLQQNAKAIPIENAEAKEAIAADSVIVLAYPTQFSNAPLLVRNFIKDNPKIWNEKQVFCMVTMGAFSGDGAGCTARLLRKYGATVLGGLHIKMPDSVCDSKLLKKSVEQNRQIVLDADQKIEDTARDIKNGIFPQDGLGIFCHLAGLFGQRLWFYGKTSKYSDKLKISALCVGCGLCAKCCPMHNITMQNGKPVAGKSCTMCYRCISHCPQQAITLLGEKVTEQCQIEKYMN